MNSAVLAELKEWVTFVQPVLRIVLILVLAWLLLHVAARLIRMFQSYMSRQDPGLEDVKRVDTLARVFQNLASLIIAIVAVLLILSELGISIAPILTAAGVAGIAIGFGAQSLVKDYFTGMLLLIENQVRQGDAIEAAGKTGLVEAVTLRHIRLRDYDGNVHYIPNGIITSVSNMSRDFVYAVIEIGVVCKEDVERMFRLIREVGAELRRDPDFAAKVLSEPEIAGIEKWTEATLTIRFRVRTRPLEQWAVRREYLLRLKKAYDESTRVPAQPENVGMSGMPAPTEEGPAPMPAGSGALAKPETASVHDSARR